MLFSFSAFSIFLSSSPISCSASTLLFSKCSISGGSHLFIGLALKRELPWLESVDSCKAANWTFKLFMEFSKCSFSFSDSWLAVSNSFLLEFSSRVFSVKSSLSTSFLYMRPGMVCPSSLLKSSISPFFSLRMLLISSSLVHTSSFSFSRCSTSFLSSSLLRCFSVSSKECISSSSFLSKSSLSSFIVSLPLSASSFICKSIFWISFASFSFLVYNSCTLSSGVSGLLR